MYQTLVLSGGGVRGISTLGALKVLREEGVLDNLKRYIGVSVGSLIATLMVMGMKEGDMYDEILNVESRDVININIVGFLHKLGLDDGVKMMRHVQKLFIKLGFSGCVTFKQLYQITGHELLIFASNVDTSQQTVFSYSQMSDCPVCEAIRMSCGIPFYFTTWVYKGSKYVDGAIHNNFPLEYACNMDNAGFVLGVFIEDMDCTMEPVSDIVTLASKIIKIMSSKKNGNSKFHEFCNVLNIPSKRVSSLSMNRASKITLFKNGEANGRRFVEEGHQLIGKSERHLECA